MSIPRRLVAPELALDLGTGNTRLASADVPLLVERPSALDTVTGTNGALAVERSVQRPVEHGVIVDLDATARMLAPHIRAGRGDSPLKPHVLVCHPSDASAEERERLVAAVLSAGAGGVRLAPQPLATVLASAHTQGAATPARLVVDLGEGVIDIAIVCEDRVLASAAVRIGLAEIRQGVREAVLKEHGVLLVSGELSSLLAHALELKDWLPVTRVPRRHARARSDGRRLLRHLVFVNGAVVAHAMDAALDTIGRSASGLLSALDPRERNALASDGLLVSGGGALVPYLCRGIAQRLGMGVNVALDPLHAVIAGTRRLLQDGPDGEWIDGVGGPVPCPA